MASLYRNFNGRWGDTRCQPYTLGTQEKSPG